MGLVLIVGMLVGGILGLIIAAMLGGAGLLVTAKNAKSRRHVWRVFAATFAIMLVLIIIAVSEFPYPEVRPGSDYEIALKNLFLQALGYCAGPGPAALLASLATFLAPGKDASATPARVR